MTRVDTGVARGRVHLAQVDGRVFWGRLGMLSDALLSAFPSRNALARMVTFGLSVNLDAITGTGPLEDVVFQLIQWAEAQGRVAELVGAACTENAGNPMLAEVAQKLFKP